VQHISPYRTSNITTATTATTTTTTTTTNTKLKKRIAYAITITKDGSFQDGAAVLAYSIMKLYKDNKKISDSYSISFIAFVHPMVIKARKQLKKIGYHVIETTTPINSTAIKYEWFREHIERNGCCGASELIKLNAYRLTQYDKIVHLDADVIVLQIFNELYNNDYSLIFTTDPNMADNRDLKNKEKLPVQGGFLVIKPSIDDYLNLVNIMLTTEFVLDRGWNNSGVGWYWGGMTIQGLLPYYYYLVSSPKRIKMVDRCLYNTMADTKESEAQSIDEIKSSHFTVCQKPWTCRGWDKDEGLCGALHRKWFQLRKEAAIFYGIPSTDACPQSGEHYVQLDFSDAILPTKYDFFVQDESPDVLLPIGNSGYKYTPKKYREEGKGWIARDISRDRKRKRSQLINGTSVNDKHKQE
jgi:lipopolysaccharide biosynthesis glycosyltransferase